MHPNPSFRTESEDRNLRFARDRAFGTLAVNADGGPLLSHIPFVISPDASSIELHLVRSNPIAQLARKPLEAVIAVTGSDSYLSPDWYEVDDQVPTWNYVAVHIRGVLHPMKHEDMHGVLERLSAEMESRLAPKKPWVSDKMDQDIYERMQRQILPFNMQVSSIDGTWKLSQNKPDEVRLRAADAVAEHGLGTGLPELAELMRNAKS